MIHTDHVRPSAPLREYVREFVLLETGVREGVHIRPIVARTDLVLAFALEATPTRALEFGHARARTMPTTVLVGPQTRRRADLWMGNRWRSFAIHFQPAGFLRLFHAPVSAFTDQAFDSSDVLGSEIACLRDALLEAPSPRAIVQTAETFLQRRLAVATPAHPTARAANAILDSHGRLSVADAIRHTGLSPRQFERCFLEQMGMAPKRYARVARLNFVLKLKQQRPRWNWAQISQEAGYFDQTHLNKDFKAMLGLSPAEYVRRSPQTDGGFLLASANAAI
jgi:AraC-like DNA-binding protein